MRIFLPRVTQRGATWLASVGAPLVCCLLLAPTAQAIRTRAVAQADRHGAVRLRLGSASLSASPGSLPPYAVVTIRRLAEHRVGVTRMYAFSTGGAWLRHPIRITLPLDAPGSPGRRAFVVFEGRRDRLYASLGTVTRSGRAVTARIPHLSTWGSLDLRGLLREALARAGKAALSARAAVTDGCAGRDDPTVTVQGPNDPFDVCVEANVPRSDEHVELYNHTDVTMGFVTFEGGLRPYGENDIGREGLSQNTIGFLNPFSSGTTEVGGHNDITLHYDATHAQSRVSWKPNLTQSVFQQLAPAVLGGIIAGPPGATAAAFYASYKQCADDQSHAALDADQATKMNLDCLFQAARKGLTIKRITFAADAKDLLSGSIRRLLKDYLTGQAQGGTLELDAAQTLPAVGGSGQPGPLPGSTPTVHYRCPNDYSNLGHYVPPNHYWTEDFVASGRTITGGSLGLGANVDGGDHRARIGIYTAFGLTGPLEEVVVPVAGYGGVNFAFPAPVSVSPGRTYYVTASGVGDFTAYDNRSGCFIGELDGFS